MPTPTEITKNIQQFSIFGFLKILSKSSEIFRRVGNRDDLQIQFSIYSTPNMCTKQHGMHKEVKNWKATKKKKKKKKKKK